MGGIAETIGGGVNSVIGTIGNVGTNLAQTAGGLADAFEPLADKAVTLYQLKHGGGGGGGGVQRSGGAVGGGRRAQRQRERQRERRRQRRQQRRGQRRGGRRSGGFDVPGWVWIAAAGGGAFLLLKKKG